MVQKGLRTVPAEPIRRAIENWIEERNQLRASELDNDGQMTGTQQAAYRIFGEERPHGSGFRKLYRILDRRDGAKIRYRTGVDGSPQEHFEKYRQEDITFDMADKILCALDLVHLWIEDEELAEAYQAVDLFTVDMLVPTSDVSRAKAEELTWETYVQQGSVERTAEELGMTLDYVRKIVQRQRKARGLPVPKPVPPKRKLAEAA